MADTKITSLQPPQVGYPVVPATDVLPIVVIADPGMATSGSTRKVTVNQILGAGGTATLASATITGDLTVDTSTLKVDSANNRVGIGTASPTAELHVIGGANFSDGTTTLRAVSSGNVAFLGTTTTDPLVLRVNNIEQYRIAQLGVFTWSDGAGTTRMTLDSTGLGVGVAPSAGKFEVLETGTGSGLGGIFASTATAGGNPGFVFRTASTNRWSISLTGTAGAESLRFYDINASATRMTLDTSGNLLVGTTSTSGDIANAKKTVGGIFSSINGQTASTATATPVTLFASQSEATYMVSAYVLGTGAPATYNAVAIVKTNAGVATLTTISSATNVTISISGLNVQATQTSGVNQVFTYNVIRIS